MNEWLNWWGIKCMYTVQSSELYSITFVSSVLLTLDTNHLNILSYIALDKAPMEYTTCTQE